MAHPAGNAAFALIALAGVFVAGWLVESAGFGAVLVMMALGIIALVIPLVFITKEESSLPSRYRRLGTNGRGRR